MLRNVLSVIAGLGVAVVTFGLFQAVGALLNPAPPNLDYNDRDAVRAFVDSMPVSAVMILLAGYIIGSFLAGALASRLLRSSSSGVLTVIGTIDLIIVGMMLVSILATLQLFQELPDVAKTFLPFVIIGASIVGGFFLGRVAARTPPRSSGIAVAATIGIVLTALWIANTLNVPHPAWMVAVGSLCFIPPALLGDYLARRFGMHGEYNSHRA